MKKTQSKPNIPYTTYHVKMNGKTRIVDVPEGVVFHLSMGHVWSSDEDRDTYNFAAIMPYDKEMSEFIAFQKDLLSAYDCHLHSVMNKYIVWLLHDATPVEKNFPFTIEDPQLEPFYIKKLDIDMRKRTELLHERIDAYKATHDDMYPDGEEYLVLERQCELETSTLVSYVKVNNLNSFAGIDVTMIHVGKQQYPLIGGIVRQCLEYHEVTNYNNYILSDEEEFNNALSTALQEINVMF